MARKNNQIFPLFEEFRRVTEELSDAQLGRVIRYAMALYYGDEQLPKGDTLTRFAAKTLLEQAYRYDGFRAEQRKRRTGREEAGPEEQMPEPVEEPLSEEFDRSAPNATEVHRSTPPSPSPSPVPSPIPNPIYIETVGLLNELSGSSFRPENKQTQRLLEARLREGYTQQDLETVIRHKCDEWREDVKLRKYLRPETLFGSKFEGYLSEATRKREPWREEIILAPLEDPYEVAVREGKNAF